MARSHAKMKLKLSTALKSLLARDTPHFAYDAGWDDPDDPNECPLPNIAEACDEDRMYSAQKVRACDLAGSAQNNSLLIQTHVHSHAKQFEALQLKILQF